MLLPASFILQAKLPKNRRLIEQNLIFVNIIWINMAELLSISEFISYL